MSVRVWLNVSDQFVPGSELFRSDRSFTVWAYTVSHSQLLLRTRTTERGGVRSSRIDVVFKPVRAMKVRTEYIDGLVIRCADQEEAEHIYAESGNVEPDAGAHCLILETGNDRDYVVAHAVGWAEDMASERDPSALAGFAPGSDPARILG
ncbi:hypothetical protein BS35_007857 [Actinomadura glauciflava]|uniref:hypothetical protein n=1 Tax=Actinomadura luteofluorescens TaxID=46163 RepID=UPI002164E79E|nr:hypothetical protein [Actinomadura glauciflava]MCR3745268.1 hypothetical protein [Actinomadura glauciflava]